MANEKKKIKIKNIILKADITHKVDKNINC